MLNINTKYPAMAVNLAGILFIIILGILAPFILFNVIMLLFVYIIRYKVNRIVIPDTIEFDNDGVINELKLFLPKTTVLGAETKMLVNKKSHDVLWIGLIVIFGLFFYFIALVLHELAHLLGMFLIGIQDSFSFHILNGLSLFSFHSDSSLPVEKIVFVMVMPFIIYLFALPFCYLIIFRRLNDIGVDFMLRLLPASILLVEPSYIFISIIYKAGDYHNIITKLNLPIEVLIITLMIIIFYNIIFVYLIGIRKGSINHE